jgi:hypothetical protein
MNFREWLQFEELELLNERNPFGSGEIGTMRGRPGSGSGFAANRSQLWGPSATYGRADTLMPWKKPAPAALTSIGQAFQKELGYQPTPIPELEPMPKEDTSHDRWGVLPLQLPPEDFKMSRRNKLGMLTAVRDMLGEGPQALGKVGGGTVGAEGGDEKQLSGEPQFQVMTQDMMGDFEFVGVATEFTEALMHYVHVVNMETEGIIQNLDWKNPEVHPNINENADPPLYEAVFRFSPLGKHDWGSAKDYRAEKQQGIQAGLAAQDAAAWTDDGGQVTQGEQ